MPIIIPEGYGELVARFSVLGRTNPVSMTMGVQITEPDDPQTVVDDFYDDLVGTTDLPGLANAAEMYSQWSFLGVEGKFTIDGVLTGISSTDGTIAGTLATANIMIVSSAVLVQKRTTRIGRRFRGRWYVPPVRVAEASVDYMGNIAPADFATISAPIFVTTSSMLAATTYKPCLLHDTGESTPPPPTIISSFGVQTKMATQRRRLRA